MDATEMEPFMTTWITICDTCKREGWDSADQTHTDGERLAALIEKRVNGQSPVRSRRVSCLMGCKHGCNVAIQAEGKLSYTLGNFAPEETSADAIVGYAEQHAGSDSGQVPYRQWPEGVKGHFITRHPPLPRE